MLCDDRDEMGNYIISECSKLVQKDCKTSHKWMWKGIQWELGKRLKFDHLLKWYVHKPKYVLENEMH